MFVSAVESSSKLAQLGELDEQGRSEARALACRLIGTPEQAPLFEDGSGHLTVPVRLKGIRIERSCQAAFSRDTAAVLQRIVTLSSRCSVRSGA